MATTLTGDGELTSFSFPILAEKTEEDSDGNLIVYGKATDGSVDSDEQIVDPKWAAKAVREWLDTGPNLRVQHNSQRDPAGVGISMETGPDGETYVKSRVIETEAKRLVKGGALRAYSVGIARPKIVRDPVARGGRIVDGVMCEISLVDRPANKNCGIQLVTKAADGTPEWVGKAFGTHEVLTKDADSISVELPKDVSVSFSPADLAKLLKHRAVAEEREAAAGVAEKRKMDPDVGEGVDRDKIPGSDFAGRDRSFPIVTPADVSDAAMSIGRAGEENFSSEKLKSNIISIARRKGPSFVAELPASWKEEIGVSKRDAEDDPEVPEDEIEKGKKGKKKGGSAFAGAAKPFGSSDDEKKDDEAKPDTTKGMKDCPCGSSYDADSKMRTCEDCGKDLPSADKAEDPAEVEKKKKVVCQGCGAMLHDKHKFCTECGKTLADAKPLKKNHDHMCLGCEEKLDKGEGFCGNCGKKNPGYLPMADSKVKVQKKKKNKKGKPVPGEGVVGPGAAAIEPVPAHREPDGTAIEAFEHDAGLPTDPDSRYLKTAARFKTVGAPNDLGALHDHLCAAFHPSDVAKCFQSDALADLDALAWQQKALDAAASAPMDEARHMTQLWQHAVTLKGTDPEILAEIRDDVHKEFTDANKGPGTFPTPTELSPTRFRRPLLTAGLAAPSPGHSGPNTHSVPTEHISASDFTEGFQQAGRAEDSPSNKGANIIEPAPLPPGMSRTYYRNAMRDSAKSAMRAMHDHIAQTFPDLCPMGEPGLGGEPPVGARPVPLPVGKSEGDPEMTAKAEKLIAKAREAAEAAGLEGVFVQEPVEKAATVSDEAVEPVAPLSGDIVKSAVLEATSPLAEQLAALAAQFADAQKTLKKQQKRLDALGDLPDPRDAPFKGVALRSDANKTATGVPVAAKTVAENAERTQLALMQALQQEARTNPDPAQREAAWSRLYQMTGINP